MITRTVNCTSEIRPRHSAVNTTINSSFSRPNPVANQLFAIYSYSSIVLALCNFVLNLLAIVVFKHRLWRRSPMSIILKYFSICEAIFNASVFVKSCSDRLLMVVNPFNSFPSYATVLAFVYVELSIRFVMLVFLICRNWNITLLAAHRYEAICLPVGSRRKFITTGGRILFIEFLILLVAVAIALPRLFEISFELCSAPPWRIAYQQPFFMRSVLYRYLHRGAVMFIFQSGGPIIIVFILSFYVLQVIRRLKKFRSRASNCNSSAAAAPTKVRNQPVGDRLILLVCLIFFILESPSFFSKILESYLRRHNMKQVDQILLLVANTCIYLDSLINIFIYILSNNTFRTISIQILRGCFLPGPRRHQPLSSQMQQPQMLASAAPF